MSGSNSLERSDDLSSGLLGLTRSAEAEISSVKSTEDVLALKVKYLGKKSVLAQYGKTMGALSPDERKARGQELNEARDFISSALDLRYEALFACEREAQLAADRIDVTLPADVPAPAVLHPITRAIEELSAIFAGMGFSFAEGPEIEDDYHNFTALNMPADHPARQMQDTFYVEGEGGYLLRTHTSSVQIRELTGRKPPLRMVSAGRVYRSDYDATHTPMFHQIEGVYIDKGVHMGHLKYTLKRALCRFFETDALKLRFRPSFFPFTEPSAEADISCTRDKEKIVVGAGDGWMEVLGCGMIHPKVLENLRIDPSEYQGFAFGLGVERLAMLKYAIPDLRTFFNPDIRWLQHYGLTPAASAERRG
jgi:phenylalanyl-tRNA synthetase alpha chain